MSLLQEGLGRRSVDRDLSGTKTEQEPRKTPFRILTLPTDKPRALIFDLDQTVYNNEPYRKDVASRELHAIAEALHWPTSEAEARVKHYRKALGEQMGRPARLTETVLGLGLTQEWWDGTREKVYQPEAFLSQDPRIATMFARVAERHKVAVATNSPSAVAEKILGILGVDEEMKGRIQIYGPDKLGTSKPDPNYFIEVARRLGVKPEQCISIGDDEENDAYPAIEAGMGAIVVSRVDDLNPVIDLTTHELQFSEFDLREFARSQYNPGEVSVVRLTGRAGAGKTTTGGKLVEMYQDMGIPAATVGLDAFFKLSSGGRKAWLEEGKQLGPEEYARRADQAAWWDFDRAAESLDNLREGKTIHLKNIYNRADKGQLTGELKVEPDPKGMVVVFEGVATAHLPKNGDHILYVNAHPKKRRERLLGRDQQRAGSAALERFNLTQSFENRYFTQYGSAVDTPVDNSNEVLLKIPAVPQL